MGKHVNVYYTCDICDKEYKVPLKYFKCTYGYTDDIPVLPHHANKITKEFDLCNECGKELEKFLFEKGYTDKHKGKIINE